MKKNFTINDFTILADDFCMISTQRQASLHFLRKGCVGEVALEKVISVGEALNADVQLANDTLLGTAKFLWVCRCNDGRTAFLPVFLEDAEMDELYFVSSEPLTKTTILQLNGLVFLLYIDDKKKASVRLLTTYYCQGLVEALLKMQKVKFTEIYLVHTRTIVDNREVGVCWSICFEEEDGSEAVMLFPVNVFDSRLMSEIGINSLNTCMVEEGETVRVDGVYYTLHKNDVGGLFLKKNELQLSTSSKNSAVERFYDLYSYAIEKSKTPAKGKHKTKIVLFKKDGK